jgi:nitroreductase|tara:strand:- start:113 stop:745 length:633 start_codon:yes stop_codon:yes gene_type:complete
MFKNMLKKAIHKSQHVQRNWDLSKSIPQEDIDLIAEAVTGAPSKQNIKFFKPYFITDRKKIEAIHRNTLGFMIEDGKQGGKALKGNRLTTNPQVLAQLLIVFVEDFDMKDAKSKTDIANDKWVMDHDRDQALGVAAGYVNLTSALLGYGTGCCSCCDKDAIQKILGIDEKPLLLMGVGIGDEEKPRREHHLNSNLTFPTKRKNIEVEYVK